MFEDLKTLLRATLGPLYELIGRASKIVVPFFDAHHLHWIFLVSTVAIALGFYVVTARGERARSARGFAAFLLPKAVYLHPSAILDYKFYLVNGLLLAGLRAGSWVGAVVGLLLLAEKTGRLLEALLGRPAASDAEPSFAVQLLYSLLVVLVVDFSKFAVHYLQHKVAVLWEFHKVHHSAEVLTPLTNHRNHPVDFVFEQVVVGVALGVFAGIFGYFYPVSVAEMTILGFGVFYFLYFLQSNLRHSHIPLAFGRRTSRLLSSPLMHQVHHSAEERHLDKNFALIFSLWDQLAGTNYIPSGREAFKLGLKPGVGGADGFDSLTALYLQPFGAVFPRRRAKRDAVAESSPARRPLA